MEEIKQGMFSCHIEYQSVICYGKIREIESLTERATFFTKWSEHYHHDHRNLTMTQAAEKCGILILDIFEMTARLGRFLAKDSRPLYVYTFKSD